MKKDEINSSADLFLYKAEMDLAAAEYLLKSVDDGLISIDLEVVYFHLQQAAEKKLKSLLSRRKIRVTKTHDIELLMEMLEGYGVSHVENVERLKKLSQYAVDGRYAILNDDIDDAEQYVRILRDLLSSAEPQEEGREVEGKE